MNFELKDQVVLITGSSKGIGKAIARAFLEEGSRVVISARNQTELDETKSEFEKKYPPEYIATFCGDLTQSKDIKAILDFVENKFHRLDHLILNLGSGRSVPDAVPSELNWNEVFQKNFGSALNMTREALPALKKNGGGGIVFISSIAGLEAIGAPVDYSTAKSALSAFAKNLSRKVADQQIRVNTVAPGNIFVSGGRWEEIQSENPSSVKSMLEEKVPMKRFGMPEEVASAVVFLSSQRASFITGATLVVDGGQTVSIS